MDLFQTGSFKLHSGQTRDWKIECDAITDSGWSTLARIISPLLPSFQEVIPVPRGGIKWANALKEYCTEGYGCKLIVDDVWTTGDSMEEMRAKVTGVKSGLVLFACAQPYDWVIPMFSMFTLQDARDRMAKGAAFI